MDELSQVQGGNVGVAFADKVFVVPMRFLDLKTYALARPPESAGLMLAVGAASTSIELSSSSGTNMRNL